MKTIKRGNTGVNLRETLEGGGVAANAWGCRLFLPSTTR